MPSGDNLLKSLKRSLKNIGETFRVSRGSSTHELKGVRDSSGKEIWFAGDVDLQKEDILESLANNDEFTVIELRPMVKFGVQYQIYARVEPLASRSV